MSSSAKTDNYQFALPSTCTVLVFANPELTYPKVSDNKGGLVWLSKVGWLFDLNPVYNMALPRSVVFIY